MITLEAQQIPQRVKQPSIMEERKRPASHLDNDDSNQPSKRQATGANGSSKSKDAEDRDPELEVFQKEAALRQMHEYKRQKAVIEKEYGDLLKKASAHDDHIRAIDSWFLQLLDEIRIAVNDRHREGIPCSTFPSEILSSDLDTFQTHLRKQAKRITDDLRTIFSNSHDREPTVAELQAEVAKLLAAVKKQANELDKIRQDNEATNERLEMASMRYMVAEKKMDRMKSQSVQKLEQQAIVSAVEPVKQSTTSTEGDTVTRQALEDAEVALQAALAESAKQAEQMEALEENKKQLSTQLTGTKVEKTRHTDDEFAETELFKQLKKQLEDFINRVNGLEASNNELRRETKKLQEERAAYRTEVDAELHASASEHQQHSSRLEADLARIRTARDELQAEKTVQETTFRNDKNAVSQLKEVLAGKDERIKTLESEAIRLAGAASNDAADVADLSIDDLRTRFGKTTKELSMMKMELDAMGKAYTKLTGSMSSKFFAQAELEEKMQRLSAEKAKADQKYFGAMKSKDTFAAEVKVLRAQNAKSSEMIASFKSLETASRQQLSNLEKQVAEAKHAFASLENKHHSIQSQVSEKVAQAEGLKKQVDELKILVSSKDAETSTVQSQLRKSEVQLEKVKATLAEKEKQFETYKKSIASTNMGGSTSAIDQEYRAMALCNICKAEFKDRIVVLCGHTFCHTCLDKRIANRLRKCPNCNLAFGTGDVRAMVL